MGIHLSGIVAAISTVPAALTVLLRHKLPLTFTLALAHISLVGFAVALATTDQFAAHSAHLLGKVCTSQATTRVCAYFAIPTPIQQHLRTADASWTDPVLELGAAVAISHRLENQVMDSAEDKY